MAIATINPTTGETLETFAVLTDAELDDRLARAARAFAVHRRTSFAERARWMNAAAALLDTERERLARLMTEEMGKTIKAARAEAEKCAWVCRYYAEHADAMLADEPAESSGERAWLRFLPLGPVLAVMPWNFPFWQVLRFAAPALMAGNVGLLKHASNVPRSALAIEDLFRRAGFPTDAFQTLLIGSDQVARVIADPRVVAVTLTGSDHAGAEVASTAGRHLKKTVLELGGSDPFVVMPSADVKAAARTAVQARMINNGQSCIAAKRFIVHERVWDQFTDELLGGIRALVVGDPLDEQTDIGPLATRAIRDELAAQVDRSVAAGARRLGGGQKLPARGWFYEPCALTDLAPAAPAYREEVFGPVALLFRARDLDHAIALANDSPYGLGSSVWTREPVEMARFVDEIEAGQTFLNGMVASDPRLPFGGVKRSGYGRELGRLGIREFVNIKSVVSAKAQEVTGGATE